MFRAKNNKHSRDREVHRLRLLFHYIHCVCFVGRERRKNFLDARAALREKKTNCVESLFRRLNIRLYAKLRLRYSSDLSTKIQRLEAPKRGRCRGWRSEGHFPVNTSIGDFPETL